MNRSKNSLSLYAFLTIYLALTCLSCATIRQDEPNFTHAISHPGAPWSHECFDDDPSAFRFAIVSDLYGGEREGVFDVAIQQLNLLRPEFIVSVGDLIDGGTEDRHQLNTEWDEFDKKAAAAHSPFFYTGGNHDLTNTVMRDVWKDRLGPRYYHFVYKNVLFLVLDSEDYNDERMQEIYLARAEALEIMDGKREGNVATSAYFRMPERRTGEISAEQSAYFEKAINENPHVRWTFLFMHKPVWMREGKGNLEHIEAALGSREYTLFNGHFHTYSHTLRNNRDYIMLGTTGGSQNDQSDMAFDHVVMVTVDTDGPEIANLKLAGILDKTGKIPGNGEKLCFQASLCKVPN